VPAALLGVLPPAVSGAGGLANDCTGGLMLPVLLLLSADRPCVPNPDSILSRRANDDENCVSILSNLVSRFATFEAVSDIFETDASSNFCPVKIGSNVTDWVGVVATVGDVDGGFVFFLF
jgi:hypothetical protein